MVDAKKLLDQFLGTGAGGQLGSGANSALGGIKNKVDENPFTSGALAGGLAGLLIGSKKGRKLGKKAVKYGGMALVAGLAYKAYRDYQSGQNGGGSGGGNQQPAPAPSANTANSSAPLVLDPPRTSGFEPSNAPQGENDFGLSLITAMISAAKADGHIDASEQQLIFEKIGSLDLDAESKAFVMDELRSPLDLDKIVALPQNEEQAVELYAASLLTIDVDHPAERGYLDMLATGLGIEPGLKSHIEEQVAQAALD